MNFELFLLMAVLVLPVGIGGYVCEEITKNVHMQDIARHATARRRTRWARL